MLVLVDLAAHLGHDGLHLFLFGFRPDQDSVFDGRGEGETHLSLDGLEVVLLPPALWLVVVRDVTVLDCFSDLDKLVDAELSPDGVGVRDEVWRVVFEVGELGRRRERQERLQQCIGRISYVPYSCKGLSSAGLWCVGERGDGPGQWSRSMARATSRRRGGE